MSVMITVEFKIKPEKVDEALEEMREGLPAVTINHSSANNSIK